MTKILLVFSGGLDSILAAKVLMEQGVDVRLLSFESPFYGADKARQGASELGLPLLVEDVSDLILSLVKNPPNGLGKHMNPCIDCHAAMFRLAAAQAKNLGCDGIASGEVLGQRPFSQTKSALYRVAKAAETEVLRPLSAKLMPPTALERSALIDRRRLLDIEGRGRSRQVELAKKYALRVYPSPAGGCLLTETDYAHRLREMLSRWPDATSPDVSLLRAGRSFWKHNEADSVLLIIGRDAKDNEVLEKMLRPGDLWLIWPDEIYGPAALMRSRQTLSPWAEKISVPLDLQEARDFFLSSTDNMYSAALSLAAAYSAKARGREVELRFELR